jgi:cob(I)alamin adenosyltransferase
VSISTKTGDKGTTDLIGGRRVPKDHPIMECLGTIDELNAFLGDAKAALPAEAGATAENQCHVIITNIQKELFVIAGALAAPDGAYGGGGAAGLVSGEERLSALITELEAEQGRFTGFAVPGDNPGSAKLHIARTVCRRAERRLVSLDRAGELPAGVLPWFNRLSDLLFLLAQGECPQTPRPPSRQTT